MADLYESIKILREACKNPRAKLDQYLSLSEKKSYQKNNE